MVQSAAVGLTHDLGILGSQRAADRRSCVPVATLGEQLDMKPIRNCKRLGEHHTAHGAQNRSFQLRYTASGVACNRAIRNSTVHHPDYQVHCHRSTAPTLHH